MTYQVEIEYLDNPAIWSAGFSGSAKAIEYFRAHKDDREILWIKCKGPTLSTFYSRFTVQDYRNAISGVGPLVARWQDSPHSLVHDLCRRLEEQA